MIEYFAVIDADGFRRGPFQTIGEASRFLKNISSDRRYTDDEARQFFLYDSAVVMVETVNGRVDFINVGWLAREKSGRQMNEFDEVSGKPKSALPKADVLAALLITLLIVFIFGFGLTEFLGTIAE